MRGSLASRLSDFSDEHRFPQFAAIARVALGRALAELESAPAGIELIRQGIEGMARNGTRAALTMYLTWLAEAYDLDGAVDQALGVIQQASSVNPEERIYQAEALRIRGGLRFKCADFENGEADVRKGALRMSRDMKALRFQIQPQDRWRRSSPTGRDRRRPPRRTRGPMHGPDARVAGPRCVGRTPAV